MAQTRCLGLFPSVRQKANRPRIAMIATTHQQFLARDPYRVFDRWRQENLFKYLREEYALDRIGLITP